MALQRLGRLAVRTSNATNAEACWELIPGSAVAVIVYELGISIAAATASAFGVGIPATIGQTPTSPVALLNTDPYHIATKDVFTAAVAVAWGTKPVAPTAYFARCSMPATIGDTKVFQFPEGILIPKASSLVVMNLAAAPGSVADIWVKAEEIRNA